MPDAPKRGSLTLSAVGNFDSLNPFLLKGIAAAGITDLVFETLMEQSLDEPFSQYGLLARDVVLAKDRLSVTYQLDPKARFSDGSPVLAEDVKFSFDTLKSQLAHPQYRFYWADIKRAVVVDARTVRFDFARVNPELHLLTGQIPIFSHRWGGGQALRQDRHRFCRWAAALTGWMKFSWARRSASGATRTTGPKTSIPGAACSTSIRWRSSITRIPPFSWRHSRPANSISWRFPIPSNGRAITAGRSSARV